jgi:hypothetical protein
MGIGSEKRDKPCATCGADVEIWWFSDCNYSRGSGQQCTKNAKHDVDKPPMLGFITRRGTR